MMPTTELPRIGFAGLGSMGSAMAGRLLDQEVPLTVWNRTTEPARQLADRGALVAETVDDLVTGCDVVLLMLANGEAIDEVLGRCRGRFGRPVGGVTLVHMGTTAPAYSAGLAVDLRRAGAGYVEAPVSGSRIPAEQGLLVGMLAGDDDAVALVRPVVDLLCRETHLCGPVPRALSTKLTVNLFLITLVTGLAEAYRFAELSGVEVSLLSRVLEAGPMASAVSTGKLAKLVAGDFGKQAGLSDVRYNTDLIAAAARSSSSPTPLLDVSRQLFREAEGLGLGDLDMVAVVEALRGRSRGSALSR